MTCLKSIKSQTGSPEFIELHQSQLPCLPLALLPHVPLAFLSVLRPVRSFAELDLNRYVRDIMDAFLY
jgi:hypothetical protein